jgi:hypothetical protein
LEIQNRNFLYDYEVMQVRFVTPAYTGMTI